MDQKETKKTPQNGKPKKKDTNGKGLYERMLMGAKEAIFTMDENHNIIFYNNAAEELWGYKPQEVIGNSVGILIKDPSNIPVNGNRKPEDEENGLGKELEVVCKEGINIPVLLSASTIQEEDETLHMAIVKDMSLENKDFRKAESIKAAIDSGWAFLEFEPDGTILSANDNFLSVLGYADNSEISGKHHRIFCESGYAQSTEYKSFWTDLAAGNINSGEFKRIRKDGEEVWINASYTPVKNDKGEVEKVIKIASDITEMVQTRKIADATKFAVDVGWANIEFDTKGNILSANDNFLQMLGYSEESEIKGQHHRIFCEKDYVSSVEYQDFWNKLSQGEVTSGEFKRIRKNGEEVWIKAFYTPFKNDKGEVVKVIKIATDITEMVSSRIQAEAIRSAVDIGWSSIELKTDGTILSANDNYLKMMGFGSAEEVIGQHHRVLLDSEYSRSPEYTEFWNALNNGSTRSGEFEYKTADDKDVWLNAAYTPVKDMDGRIFKVIKIAMDITPQKNVINAIQDVVESAAQEGDLSARLDATEAEGDYLELVTAMNKLLDIVSQPIQDISELANVVAAASEEMLTKGDEMKGSTGEMSSAIQQMAEGAQDQAQQIDDISKLIEDVLKSAKEMGRKSDVITKAAEEGKNSSKEGLQTIGSVVESMEGIEKAASVTSQSIEVLTKRSEEIARTLNVITDIASQTNLLALNAAIEAARAGDAGRGFAVVAEEIRKLAEDSRSSASDIEKVIKEVQKDIGSADHSIKQMEGSVSTGNKASKEAEKVFQYIDQTSEKTYSLSDDILKTTKQQEESIDNTVKNVEKIVVVSEETASGTEQVAASSKELSQGMDEVSASSKDLANLANQLLESVSKFKLKS